MFDRRSLLLGSATVAPAASMPSWVRSAGAAVSPADWARIVEKAKKEGEVALYSSGIARIEEPKMKEFEQRSGIKARYARPGGGEIVIRKFETEFTAGKPLADVCTLTDTALGMYAEEKGYVAPIATPNEARLDPAFKRQSPAILPTGGFCLVIAYNNKMIKPEQAPKGYLDLADPRFKGQVLFGAVGVEHEAINCVDCHATKTMQTGAGLGKGLSNKDGKTYWMNDITSHLFDVPRKTNKALKGVEPGKAMPIPYINACGACHDADNL